MATYWCISSLSTDRISYLVDPPKDKNHSIRTKCAPGYGRHHRIRSYLFSMSDNSHLVVPLWKFHPVYCARCSALSLVGWLLIFNLLTAIWVDSTGYPSHRMFFYWIFPLKNSLYQLIFTLNVLGRCFLTCYSPCCFGHIQRNEKDSNRTDDDIGIRWCQKWSNDYRGFRGISGRHLQRKLNIISSATAEGLRSWVHARTDKVYGYGLSEISSFRLVKIRNINAMLLLDKTTQNYVGNIPLPTTVPTANDICIACCYN